MYRAFRLSKGCEPELEGMEIPAIEAVIANPFGNQGHFVVAATAHQRTLARQALRSIYGDQLVTNDMTEHLQIISDDLSLASGDPDLPFRIARGSLNRPRRAIVIDTDDPEGFTDSYVRLSRRSKPAY